MFAAAVEQLRATRDVGVYRADYGTRLRDGAGMLALVSEAGLARETIQPISRVIEEERGSHRPTSTQENAWMVLAAEALARDAETIALSVDGTPRKGSLYRTFRPATLERGPVTLANTGTARGAGRRQRHRQPDELRARGLERLRDRAQLLQARRHPGRSGAGAARTTASSPSSR